MPRRKQLKALGDRTPIGEWPARADRVRHGLLFVLIAASAFGIAATHACSARPRSSAQAPPAAVDASVVDASPIVDAPAETAPTKTARELPSLLPVPTLPLTRPFRELSLPKGLRIDDFAGAGSRAWILSDEEVLEHDGSKLIHKSSLCGAERIQDASYSPRYKLRTDGSVVHAVGALKSGDHVVAELRPGRAAICRTYPAHSNRLLLNLVLLPKRGDFIVRANTIVGIQMYPSEDGEIWGAFFAPRRSSLWVQIHPWPTFDFPTYHFDGATWRRVPAPPFGMGIGDMWADPTGVVWAVRVQGWPVIGSWPETEHERRQLAQYDGEWTLLAIPERFRPKHITGTARDDVWFIEQNEVYQWDGERWRAGSYRPTSYKSRQIGFRYPPFMDGTGSLWLVADTTEGPKLFRTPPKADASTTLQRPSHEQAR
jgi:hypothetical protein